MPAFVFVSARLSIRQPQEDALLIERSIAVAKLQTFGRDIVDGGETFHSENHINPS